MKKIILLVLAMVLLVSTALAEDLSSLTDEELKALYDRVACEMADRDLFSKVPDDPDREIKNRLYEFMCLWSENDIAGMVYYSTSDWQAKQDNPQASMYSILKNRKPLSYEYISVSGDPEASVRVAECKINIDWNTGKMPETYCMNVTMVLEEDGRWHVDPTSLETDEIPEPTLVPELTPAPDGAAAGTAGDTVDAEIKKRLNEFIFFWATNDCPSMVNYCTSDWKSKQENPQASLLAVLKNRTAVSYKLNALLKAPDNKSCTASCNIEIDSNIGKPHRIYLYLISMVLEDDGLWYVDPASLATNEIPEPTLVPELTPAPSAEITGDTILYYNPEGGSKYHLDPYCKTVNPKFLPLQGTFRYSEVNDPQYQELRTCHICLAPERPSGDSGELSPSDYTQKAWAFTPEIYTVIQNNPDSILNQSFYIKGLVQEVLSENPLTVIINAGDDGESLPVIIESPDADKFHWEKGCKYQIYGDFVAVKDNMPVLAARFSFTW